MAQTKSNSLEQLLSALKSGAINQETYDAAASAIAAQLQGSGAVAQGSDSLAVGEGGVGIDGDNSGPINLGRQLTAEGDGQIVYAEKGATVIIGEAPVEMTAVDRESADR